MIRITLSDMPPSANAMRTSFIRDGKVHSAKSKTYAQWKTAAAWEIASARQRKVMGPYRLYIAAQRDWRSKRARDLDNIIKPVSDALVASGLIKDDSLAEEVSAKWADNLDGVAIVALIVEAEEAIAA